MTNSSTRSLQLAEKGKYQPWVLRKRIQEGWSYRRLARELREQHGVDRTRSTICKWVKDALAERAEERKELADDYIELQVQRLSRQLRLINQTLAQVDAECDEYEAGELQPSLIREKRQLIEQMRRTNESLRKLLGLDEPETQELEVKHSYEMNIPEPDAPTELEEEEARELPEGEVLDAEFDEIQEREAEVVEGES